MPVKKGNKVRVEYVASLDDGTVFDSSEGKRPLEFEVGSGQVIKAIDQAVIGMEKGEEKEIKVEPKDAFGDRVPELIKKVPRNKLPEEAEEGMMLRFITPEGVQIPGQIIELTENDATIDFNHPLAGLELNFKIKVTEIL
ncbi:MAG: peptidylprolyl isomerase [Candidatus Jordarchaeaceae archaeon]